MLPPHFMLFLEKRQNSFVVSPHKNNNKKTANAGKDIACLFLSFFIIGRNQSRAQVDDLVKEAAAASTLSQIASKL